MANPPLPTPPARATSFTDITTNNPTQQQPGDKLDAEYDRSNTAIAALIAFVQTLFQADGTLKPGTVGTAALTSDLAALMVQLDTARQVLTDRRSLQWAEYLAGPVVSKADAPAYIASTPYPNSLFSDPVQGGSGGMFSAKYWALQAASAAGAATLNGTAAAPLELPPEKTVFIGGLGPNLLRLADPVAMAPLLADGRIGLYNHPVGTNLQFSDAQLRAMWATWGPTGVNPDGSGQSAAEVGPATAYTASDLRMFGGRMPPQVNMNVGDGAGGGASTHTSSLALGDTVAGIVGGHYYSPAELASVHAAIDACIRWGATNVAPVVTPNNNDADLTNAFATSSYWAPVRDMCLYGGGISLDCPTGYFWARGPAYQEMVAQMVRWGRAQGLRTSFIVSPYASTPDASGNTGANGYQADFLQDVMRQVAFLASRDALPSQWIVETYGVDANQRPLTENGIGIGDEAQSLNAIALYLARSVRPVLGGTRQPGAPGSKPDRGTQQLTTPRPALVFPLARTNRVRLADVIGAGTMAQQNAYDIRINGGTIRNVYIETFTTPLFANNLIVQGTSAAVVLDGNTAGTLHLALPTGAAVDLALEGQVRAGTYAGPNASAALMRYGLVIQGAAYSFVLNLAANNADLQLTASNGATNWQLQVPGLQAAGQVQAARFTNAAGTGAALLPYGFTIQGSGAYSFTLAPADATNLALTATNGATNWQLLVPGLQTSGSVSVGNSLSVTSGIELGSFTTGGAPRFLDFHSCVAANTNDYDARILSTGGTAGTVGAGTLAYTAAAHNFTGLITGLSGITSSTGTSLTSGGMFRQIGSRVTPVTGDSVTIPNSITRYMVDPAGTIAALTITMPAAPLDAQLVTIQFGQTVTALTLAANAGQTFRPSGTSLALSGSPAPGGAKSFYWAAAQSAWFPV